MSGNLYLHLLALLDLNRQGAMAHQLARREEALDIGFVVYQNVGGKTSGKFWLDHPPMSPLLKWRENYLGLSSGRHLTVLRGVDNNRQDLLLKFWEHHGLKGVLVSSMDEPLLLCFQADTGFEYPQ